MSSRIDTIKNHLEAMGVVGEEKEKWLKLIDDMEKVHADLHSILLPENLKERPDFNMLDLKITVFFQGHLDVLSKQLFDEVQKRWPQQTIKNDPNLN